MIEIVLCIGKIIIKNSKKQTLRIQNISFKTIVLETTFLTAAAYEMSVQKLAVMCTEKDMPIMYVWIF